MANFYFTDADGNRQGSFTLEQLQELVNQGIVKPDTPLETESGQKGLAKQIRALKFPIAEPSPFDQTVQVASPSVSVPIAMGNKIPLWVTAVGIVAILLVLVVGGVSYINEYDRTKRQKSIEIRNKMMDERVRQEIYEKTGVLTK